MFISFIQLGILNCQVIDIKDCCYLGDCQKPTFTGATTYYVSLSWCVIDHKKRWGPKKLTKYLEPQIIVGGNPGLYVGYAFMHYVEKKYHRPLELKEE
ncbi:hypothetical protein Cantr_02282 [Candida viswanathii]|uniref:Uncharacterized protein n=1 Tax=Candida viswanathii TaxID=5486 RepID=A0A367YME8_9ASCO|nr:hypothetical protein Cantr_02282 [Candida viswanathii]